MVPTGSHSRDSFSSARAGVCAQSFCWLVRRRGCHLCEASEVRKGGSQSQCRGITPLRAGVGGHTCRKTGCVQAVAVGDVEWPLRRGRHCHGGEICADQPMQSTASRKQPVRRLHTPPPHIGQFAFEGVDELAPRSLRALGRAACVGAGASRTHAVAIGPGSHAIR